MGKGEKQMVGAIMQPTVFPWMGYFAMIDRADVFVFLDHVQLERSSWQIRNKIKLDGKEQYITVPVEKKSLEESMIKDAVMLSGPWRRKHLHTLYHAYHKAPYFTEVYELIEKEYRKEETFLAGFTESIICSICEYLSISTKILSSSEMGEFYTRKDDMLVEICRKADIDYYIAAYGSHAYIERETLGGALRKNGLEIGYQHYEHPTYTQGAGEFIPYLSILDVLFWHGTDSLTIIREGVQEDYTPEEIKDKNEKENRD